MTVRYESDIAVVVLDSPPVNMGNAEVRRDLLAAFIELADRDDLSGVVLTGGRSHFYAGSDIKEFDRLHLESPSLPEVIAAVERVDVPTVAAIQGLALGGGLELALAFDARIGEEGSKYGLPEVTLGIIPGAGGTVRLPRLVGAAVAIELISSGRQISSAEALEIGLLDRVAPLGHLLAEAIQWTRVAQSKRRIRDMSLRVDAAGTVAAASEKASRRARPNVLTAIDLIVEGAESDFDEAIRRERATFEELRRGAEAVNLRYLFFARRAAAKAFRSDARAGLVSSIGVAGAGTMGAAIARACAHAGYSVILFDENRLALERAIGAAGRDADAISATLRIESLGSAELVIDAVFEDMAVKQDLFARIEEVVAADAVLASNTSYLDVNEMAARLAAPARFAGMHFFNPADRNRLVEVIRTGTTADGTVATIGAVLDRLGKTAVAAGVGEGFIGNRVYSDYRMQAEYLVEDGAAPEEVDKAMVALGLPIGPFAVADMSGLDIAWARRQRLSATRDPGQRYVEIADRLCETGRLGRKTGAGWYAYPHGALRGTPDAHVQHLVAELRAAKGIKPVAFQEEQMQQRIVCSMLCAAAEVVERGVARQASDVDVVMTEGFAFPARLGGPIRYAAGQPQHWIMEGLAEVYRSDPIGFSIAESATMGEVPGEIQRLLHSVRL